LAWKYHARLVTILLTTSLGVLGCTSVSSEVTENSSGVTSSAPEIIPSNQEAANPTDLATSKDSAAQVVGPASIPALNQQWRTETGLRYGEVRRRLIAQGWIPHTIETTGPVRHYNPGGLLKKMYDLGYEEVVDCAGTGLAPCRFEFVYQDRTLENGPVLAVIATVASGPNPDPYFAGMNPDAYGVNTEYQNRALDASLFTEIQQDEGFCGAIGTCSVSSPYVLYQTQSQYAFQDVVIVARAYREGVNRAVIFPRRPVSRAQALEYARILDTENTIDLSDRNRELYNHDQPIESYAAPGEGPRNLIHLVLTPDGQVSEINFVNPGAL